MPDFETLFAAAADGSVVRLGDDYDLFGLSDFCGLVTDRKKIDVTFGALEVVLHQAGRWYAGRLQSVRSTNEMGKATDSLWPLGVIVEIPGADALARIVKQFSYVPPEAAELFSAGKPPAAPDRQPTAKPAAKREESPRKRLKTGRPPDTDFAADRRVADEWDSKKHKLKTYAKLADALDMTEDDVRRAVDRDSRRRKE